MLRVSGKRLVFSVTGFTLLILVVLPPNVSEESRAHKVQVVGAVVLAVRDGGTHLGARVLVAAFSASVAAISFMSPAVFFMLKEADAGTTLLALRLGSIVGIGNRSGLVAVVGIVTVVAMCASLCDELRTLVSEFGKFRRHSGGRRERLGGDLSNGVHGGEKSSGWVLMRGQVCHEGGEIIAVKVEFISFWRSALRESASKVMLLARPINIFIDVLCLLFAVPCNHILPLPVFMIQSTSLH